MCEKVCTACRAQVHLSAPGTLHREGVSKCRVRSGMDGWMDGRRMNEGMNEWRVSLLHSLIR